MTSEQFYYPPERDTTHLSRAAIERAGVAANDQDKQSDADVGRESAKGPESTAHTLASINVKEGGYRTNFKQFSPLSLSEDKLVIIEIPRAKATANKVPDSATWSQPRYISPYLSFAYSRSSHRLSSYREDNHTFVRHVRPVILLALLDAAAGLVAWLVGYMVGHLALLISVRLGLRKVSGLSSGRWDNPREGIACV